MRELRCVCGRKLGEWDGNGKVEIKCRCGKLMKFGTPGPFPARRAAPGPQARERATKI
ncbi:MAG: hypothetical protein KKC30_15690 [Proteobacteria bacterium]|nr:hypothetical protein [Pseudomonadota bacterium]MBU4381575.1 hypothetical protein [Pseudomonadota bacterium]MCG2766561.1 hypothetical protein [Desulfarculaceae bacterium]